LESAVFSVFFCAVVVDRIDFGDLPVKTPLDRIDSLLVSALQNNARLSNKELAARVGLAPSSCLERVRRLLDTGVLRGFHADVAPAALGVTLQAMIAVRLRQHSRDLAAAFRRHVDRLPEVIGLFHIAGENDYLLQVAVRDVDHLRNFTLDQLTARDEVAHVETALIFEHVRKWTLPDYRPSETSSPPSGRAGRQGPSTGSP
jgi:DNA-binding Lrp family transcriptional regulator